MRRRVVRCVGSCCDCVHCGVYFDFLLSIFIQGCAFKDLDVGWSSGGNGVEYSPTVFINASPEACSAFDFSAFTGALQSEVFIGGQGSDDELLSDVFVGGVSLCIYVVAHFCLLMATVYFLIL